MQIHMSLNKKKTTETKKPIEETETASRAQMCHQLQNIHQNEATKQANEQQTSDNTA